MKELFLINCRLDRRYDIRSLLGRGSYAEVYVADDILSSAQSPHRNVAIKALNVFLQDDLDSDLERTLVENFQNEATALDRVRHPNIISRFGHGTARDLNGTVFHYLVLEYLAGGDLHSYLRKNELSHLRAFNLIEQVCAGLRHAHQQGIIHRDIKPQNLLLTSDHSTVKIADFGVARDLVSESPITRVGTNVYAPPEHSPLTAIRNDHAAFGHVTPAADIYSLAKTIYTILSGEAPRAFTNETISSLPESINSEDWADDLLRVLKRSTDAEPSNRYQTIDELWNDLLLIRDAISDGEVSTLVRTRKAAPQPHVVRGYTPFPPSRPSFSEITDIETRVRPPRDRSYTPEPPVRKPPITRDSMPAQKLPPFVASETNGTVQKAKAPIKPRFRRRLMRKVVTFSILGTLLAGMIFGVSSIFQNFSILPEFQNPFRQKTGIANTDIYLRPDPNTENEPIGLVTRNSIVRIVNTRNNWYQVDVIEQGRIRTQGPNSQRGWLNGKYITLE